MQSSWNPIKFQVIQQYFKMFFFIFIFAFDWLLSIDTDSLLFIKYHSQLLPTALNKSFFFEYFLHNVFEVY